MQCKLKIETPFPDLAVEIGLGLSEDGFEDIAVRFTLLDATVTVEASGKVDNLYIPMMVSDFFDLYEEGFPITLEIELEV